jgi:hypothetical protein
MRERALPIPPDQIRGRDLYQWHIVIVECCYCRLARVMDHKRLTDARHRDLRLSEMRFWCGSCRRGGPHIVTVTRAPKHY